MSNNNQTTSSGLGIGTVLFLIFLTLKLTGIGQVADWSWWWITSPLWVPILLAILIFIIAFIIAAISK